jgi:hypothetical protein
VILDLNAKRAARAVKRGEGMKLILGEETFDLVDELPIEIGELAADNKIPEALRMMLNDPADWDRLRAQKPSFNDVLDVVEFFGTALGESVRVQTSSTNTGLPSKPTSSGTTDENSLATVTEISASTPAASPA